MSEISKRNGIIHWSFFLFLLVLNMFDTLYPWITWAGILSLVMFVGALFSLPLIISRLPVDIFMGRKTVIHSHPVIHILLLILKNIVGLILLIMGIIMLFVPGQGFLTVLAGLLLMTFPGKKYLIHRLLAFQTLQNGLNRIRRKMRKEEFEFFQE